MTSTIWYSTSSESRPRMDIVAAYACSHAGLISTRRQRADESTQASVFGAYDRIRQELEELRPDALLDIATDHMQAYPLPLVPQIGIGVGRFQL